jgi:predicted RND superfamily exporter protein
VRHTMRRTSLFTSYLEWIIRHRLLVLSLIGGITIILAAGLSKVFVEVDPAQQLPQSHPYVQSFHDVHRLFGDWNLVMIGMRPHDGLPFAPSFLEKVRATTDRIGALPGAVKALLQSIAAPNAKSITMDGDDISVEPLMKRSPVSSEDARKIQVNVLTDPSFSGTLVSFDGSSIAIYSTFELTPELPGYVNLHRAVLDILTSEDDGTFDYYMSGPVVMASSLSTYAAQVGYLFPLALVVIGLIHFHAFRTWQAVILPLLTGVLAVVWGLGLMGYAGAPLDPLNSTTPVLILAVGAGHAVQVLKRYYEALAVSADNTAAIINSISEIGPIMLAAGTIAAFSFFSLAMIGTESMRTFGAFTGLGVSAVVIIELTLIPALRSALGRPDLGNLSDEQRLHPKLDRDLRNLSGRLSTPSWARCVLLVYLAVVLASCILAQRIEIDTSFKRNFSTDDQVWLDDAQLNELFGGTNSVIFTITGNNDNAIATPAAIRSIARFQRRLEEMDGVGKTLSIADLVGRLHEKIAHTHGELPDSSTLILQYLFLYSLAGGDNLATTITPDNRATKVVAMIREDSTRFGEEFIARAKVIAAEELPSDFALGVAGSVASNAALTEVMVRGKALNILQIAAATVVISSIIFRSALAGMLVALPLAIAVILNLGAMGLLGIKLDIATSAITAMAVGIGADYAVYFLFSFRRELRACGDYDLALLRTFTSAGKAILYVSSAVGLGYSVLCLSTLRMLVQLGALVALAMFTSCLSTLLILPALLTMAVRSGRTNGILAAIPLLDRPRGG